MPPFDQNATIAAMTAERQTVQYKQGEWREWAGGPWTGDIRQLVQIVCVGGTEDVGAQGEPFEAGLVRWEWSRRPGFPDEPHHGNIVRWRPVYRLIVQITVDNLGASSTHTNASLMPPDVARALLMAASEALGAELEDLDKCPWHVAYQRLAALAQGPDHG